jgi:hypothetical protein
MKRLPLVLLAAALARPAAAQTVPSTLVLPTPVVTAIRQYLGQRPHDEVAAMIDALEACVALQMPGHQPSTAADAACPAVAAALKAPTPPAK